MLLFQELTYFNVVKLYRFLLRNKDDMNLFNPHDFNIKSLLKNIHNKKDFFVCLFFKKKIIGYGMLRGWKDGYEVPSLGIMIDKDYRGIGASKLLMNYLHIICKFKNCEKVMLKVNKDNKRAINLYEKLDYNLNDYDEKFLIGYKKIN